jgi:hypothetical protein
LRCIRTKNGLTKPCQVCEVWFCSQLVAAFQFNEKFEPTSLLMHEGITTPPSLLTESDLIRIMDENGIGNYYVVSTSIVEQELMPQLPNIFKRSKIADMSLKECQEHFLPHRRLELPWLRVTTRCNWSCQNQCCELKYVFHG